MSHHGPCQAASWHPLPLLLQPVLRPAVVGRSVHDSVALILRLDREDLLEAVEATAVSTIYCRPRGQKKARHSYRRH